MSLMELYNHSWSLYMDFSVVVNRKGCVEKVVSSFRTDSFICICCSHDKMNAKEIAIRYFKRLKGMVLQPTNWLSNLVQQSLEKIIFTQQVNFHAFYRTFHWILFSVQINPSFSLKSILILFIPRSSKLSVPFRFFWP